jgi:hypothetical protein
MVGDADPRATSRHGRRRIRAVRLGFARSAVPPIRGVRQEGNDMQDELGVNRMHAPGAEPDHVAVVGLFDHIDDASRAVDELAAAGFDRDAISLVASNADRAYDGHVRPIDDEYDDVVDADHLGTAEGAAAGGGIGAAVGGLGGVLMGLGLLAVPGVGPALAAGPIISGLVGAGIGGAAGGIVGALANSGISEDRAGAYAEGVRRGGTLVLVDAPEEAVARAEDVMVEHGVVDIDERITAWRDEGWSGFESEAAPYTREELERERRLRAQERARIVSGGRH